MITIFSDDMMCVVLNALKLSKNYLLTERYACHHFTFAHLNENSCHACSTHTHLSKRQREKQFELSSVSV